MAQFSYAEHMAQQAANKNNSGNRGPDIHFMGEFLKGDGDVAIVRFPYHSMNDIVYTTTHNMPMPGAPYGKQVRCTGDDQCELCKEGNKVNLRFLAKFLVYTVNDNSGEVVLNNTIWDRPSAFADIDLKGLFEEYGDISNSLFKVKRNGTGTATRYTISIIVNNNIYKPEIYKADFTELEQVDVLKILTKSITQYRDAFNPNANKSNLNVQNEDNAQQAAPQQQAATNITQTNNTEMETNVSVDTPPFEETKQAPTVNIDTPVRRQTRYTF